MKFASENRNQQIVATLKRLTASLLSIYLVVLLFWLFLLSTDKYNGDVIFVDLFYQPFTNLNTFVQILKQFAPFLIGSVAVLICFNVGFINLGVAGQMSASGLVIFALANHLNMANLVGDYKVLWIFLLLVVGILTAMTIAIFTGALKIYFGVSEILTTIMLNYVIMHVYRFYVSHPDFTNLIGRTLTMNNVNNLMGINLLIGNLLPVSLFVAFFVVIVFVFLFKKTLYGFKMKILAINHKAVRYAGINRSRELLGLIAFSGLLAGLAGIFYYYRNFDNNYLFKEEALPSNGFDTISIVWLSQGSFFVLPFVTFFVAMLRYQQTQIVTSDLPASNVEIILGFILLTVAFMNRLLSMSKAEKVVWKAKLQLYFAPLINFWTKHRERKRH